MLFFLLLKAAPAMNVPTADDDYSPRKIWLEISSQILNARMSTQESRFAQPGCSGSYPLSPGTAPKDPY
jgi:hypothetical protein